ncbi:bifunctional tRNA (5-methylaminomethyl-2-thiouridine)(34)-methyltransferase MnmD/FAD-dependent 5-carboxymethylaminomethyl-2-thiouridine(34) oxidoreductase MnmC [Marinobacterium sp. D7]|uniref:bifunctional tRNA (5-methylaminomethyl-2-thiouridine)(34)-methyltransferase MnmD/FAD-dependent 5-carboxymethylaminomethyl-2-thiouridine(34) oxidoreductase MnmC n=1 Tax=Marinobacterium ramblicola TaxID=2849041 RepID=UPI001C2D1DB8|nr:bifunctional tRNA (5-methylaminomethyl-2-thiouridine)(34)-methyltransferase MnmD/FAD-dependent 5-carboxymethylaminomethyl-2-thiouridine(34) oxidoreductase MnmC [Marinobacterium ramblicola]MBV1789379.1 bifunctional tRNA (5-methylaminomethyl-2-thiouridine)(34)-methyltransferase MnmD/FAD-dependent 5-carboxymethylaminomethyl-2-thiouridine(34) oxidoreductase MnmC [Marinobacterium ramblicola]
MNRRDEKLTPAELSWQDNTPVSVQFDDIYFNKAGGLAETEYVFLAANQLDTRWRELAPGSRFTLAETGFGTGLNFLCARRLWLAQAPESARLHYISCEKHPLLPEDLAQALAQWPELESGARQLLTCWPAPLRGFYTLVFDGGRILLTLAFGDAAEMLAELDGQVDAWFLDGFAPARNPGMWSPELFQQIAAHSHIGTTFATFTAAGLVRRGLAEVGFAVSKLPGFGRKREMLNGRFESTPDAAPQRQPWLARPSPLANTERHAIVVGAGIAGCSAAAALARRGWRVDLLERNAAPALEGSGNPQGALFIKLATRPTRQSELHVAGLHYSAALIRRLADQQPELGDICGVLSLALSDKEARHQQQLADSGIYPEQLARQVTQQQACELAGLELSAGGLYFPEAGWASPPLLCQRLLADSTIRCHFDTPVQSLHYNAESAHWEINGGAHCAPVVIVCSAAEANRLEPLASLPLKPIRGQTTQTEQPEHPAPLKRVVCGEGYISPALDGRYCFGASFKLHDLALDIRAEEHQANLDLLERAIPELARALDITKAEGRVAYRATTPDYLPIVGPVPEFDWVEQRFARLRQDSKWRFEPGMRHLPGLYVNAGHGSKGLVSCPISAEFIAALVDNAPLPLPRRVADALNPVRFVIKNLIRRTI